MEPTAIVGRLASAAIGPLVRKLFVTENPGAGLVDKPIRISSRVSFKGEKRTLTDSDLRGLAAKLVKQALRSGERPIPADEQQAVTDALATTLHALGDVTLTDLEAVRLGHVDFARDLRRAGGSPERHLSADATYFYERLLNTACLHILNFFTQRSTFVASSLVQQARAVDELIAKVDELIRRQPLPGGEDAAFEQAYLAHLAKKHSRLTIYGIDLANSPRQWPLDVAYLSLEASPRGYRLSRETVFQLLRDIDGKPPRLSGTEPRLEHRAVSHGELSEPWRAFLSDPSDVAAVDAERALAMVMTSEQYSDHFADRIFARPKVSPTAHLTSRPADQALAASPRVLLRGEAGSGKTTLIQWLAVTTARQDLPDRMEYLYDRIPFVLPLRTLTRDGGRLPTPREFLAATGCPLDGTQPDGWENRVLVAGRGLVLVDGIDEVPARERERARRWLRELIETYDGDNRWLVTSRPSAVDQDWLAEEGFTELTLSAMGPAETTTFIRRWYDAARCVLDDDSGQDERAELDKQEAQLLRAVRAEPDLGHLATNPLMCGLICALHRDRRGYLPHGRKDLYEAALSMLLSRRDRERDMTGPELADDPQLDVLQRLAYWLIKNGRTELDRARAEEIIRRALPSVPQVKVLGDAPAVYDHFLQRSGLLREPEPGIVHFIHRTFQDFLGARAALEEGDFGLLVQHAADDQWEDVIRMAVALGRARERAEIFAELLKRGDAAADKSVRARIYLLAAACLDQATSLEPSVRDEVRRRAATLIPPKNDDEARALAEVGPLVLSLLPGPEDVENALTACHVVAAAARVTSEAAVPFLARFADHPFRLVRTQLQQAWPRFDTARYAEEVIARLDQTGLDHTIQSDDQLRELTRIGLRPKSLVIRGGVSVPALASYLSQDDRALRSLWLSGEAITDLGFLAGQTGLEALTVRDCPALVDLSALGGLPIRSLSIHVSGPDVDLSPFARMANLEVLGFGGPSAGTWSLRDLPAQAPMGSLSVWGNASPAHGLEGLGALARLTSLALGGPSSPASAGDWEEIAGLPGLDELAVPAVALECLPQALSLGGVTQLSLDGGGGDRVIQAAVSRLPTAFPRLAYCQLTGEMTAEGDIDIAPLAGLPDLRTLYIAAGSDRIRGAGALPSSVAVELL